ncbi:phage portal protein, partial [Streptococcus danieliae]|nr:phage portal protein [Streptococcus danieliae]
LGIPVKITHNNEVISDVIKEFRKINDMLDSEFELSKMTNIFGHSFIYLFQDEDAVTRMTYNSPINMIMIHDNSISELPLCAIRYSLGDNDGDSFGEVITND